MSLLAGLLTQTATVFRRVQTQSVTGAATQTWTEIGTVVCAIQMTGSSAGQQAGAPRDNAGFAIYTLPGAALTSLDAVVPSGPIGAIATPNGPQMFFIDSGPVDESGQNVLWVYRGTRIGGMRDFS